MDTQYGSPGTRAIPEADLPLGSPTNYALSIASDGTILSCDASLADRLGVPLPDLLGKVVYDFFPPDAARFRRSMVEAAVREGQPRHFLDCSRSGNVLETLIQPLFDSDGNVASLAVFVADVTSHQQVFIERKWLSNAIEQAAEAFIILNEDLNIRYVNQAFEEMTGWPQAEAIGQSLRMLYNGAHQLAVFEELCARLQNGDIWSGRAFNTRRDGHVIRVDKTVSPIRGYGGVILGYVSVWRDVTQVSELERQLRQAQKMEAIGTLAGGIAHDFNNILGPIILHSEMGLHTAGEDESAKRGFAEILAAANRAKALVKQILALSRSGEGDAPVRFRLTSICKECLKLLRPSLPATIAIDFREHTESDIVLADPTQIHQVVMNLCTNAAQAMRDSGGRLRIDIGEACLMHEQSHSGRRYAALTVFDTGHGIEEDHMPKLFEPFFTTRSRSGTGLGLAVVKGIVTHLDGVIDVQSVPGRGTRFTVFLPCAAGFGQMERGKANVGLNGRGERILYVEDEKAMRDSTALALRGMGYSVVPCSGGGEALESAARSGGFDLVISDVTMPGMTGVEFASRIREQMPEVPIILCTGFSELASPEIVHQLGARMLRKPYGMDDMGRAVREALDAGGASDG